MRLALCSDFTFILLSFDARVALAVLVLSSVHLYTLHSQLVSSFYSFSDVLAFATEPALRPGDNQAKQDLLAGNLARNSNSGEPTCVSCP